MEDKILEITLRLVQSTISARRSESTLNFLEAKLTKEQLDAIDEYEKQIQADIESIIKSVVKS